MDLKHHEDTILYLISITITILIVYGLRGFYVEFAMYFGWIALFIVHLIIVSVCVILIAEKIKYFFNKNKDRDIHIFRKSYISKMKRRGE